jgi:hypothetical protein
MVRIMKRPAPAVRAAAKGLTVGLLVFSTVLVYFFPAAGTMFRRNALPLPFGFSYQLRQESGFRSGRIQSITPETIQGVLGAGPRGDLLVLDSWIYSPRPQAVNLRFSGNGGRELFVNNLEIADSASTLPTLKLKEGYNRISIKFVPDRDGIPQLSFQVSERVAFYDFMLPQSRASRILSRFLSFLDRCKLAFFALTLLFLLFRMIPAASSPESKPPVEGRGAWSSFFRAFSFFSAVAPSAVYLNHAIGPGVSDRCLVIGSALLSLWVLIKDPLRKTREFRFDRPQVVVFSLIVLSVFLQIFLTSHSFLPPPVQASDFPNHLGMMQYYSHFGDIDPRKGFIIYPQGIHDVLVLTAGFVGLSLEKTLIIFLVFVLIMTYEAVFLLSRDLLGRIHPVYFFLALSLSYFPFIYSRFFQVFSFPSMLAILFFLLSLHYFLKEDRLVSSVLLAGAMITYPYYVFFFGVIILILFLDRTAASGEPARRKLKRTVSYFFPSVVLSAVYFLNYWAHGSSQQQEGFKAAFKINPFLSMHGINALLFLAGMYYLSKAGNNRTAVLTVLGLIAGFAVYYVPYRFFSMSSTYYFMKNMQVLILMGILVEMFALSRIFRKWEDRACLKYLLSAGAIGIFVSRVLGFINL